MSTMRKLFLVVLAVLLTSVVFADQRSVYKLRIRHADPALIYSLLRGTTTFATEPEVSSKPATPGNGGFGRGRGG